MTQDALPFTIWTLLKTEQTQIWSTASSFKLSLWGKMSKTTVTFSTLVQTKETYMVMSHDSIAWCHHKLMVCLVGPHQLIKSDIYKLTTVCPQQIGTWQWHFPIAFRPVVVSVLKPPHDVAILQWCGYITMFKTTFHAAHFAVKDILEILSS